MLRTPLTNHEEYLFLFFFFLFQGSTHKHWNVNGHVEGVAWRREEVLEESEEEESEEEESEEEESEEEESEEEEEAMVVAVTEQKKSRSKGKQREGRNSHTKNSCYYGVETNVKRFNARIWLNGRNKVKSVFSLFSSRVFFTSVLHE